MSDRTPTPESTDSGIRPNPPEGEPTTTPGSFRFALLWFGVPLLLLVLLIVLRKRG